MCLEIFPGTRACSLSLSYWCSISLISLTYRIFDRTFSSNTTTLLCFFSGKFKNYFNCTRFCLIEASIVELIGHAFGIVQVCPSDSAKCYFLAFNSNATLSIDLKRFDSLRLL